MQAPRPAATKYITNWLGAQVECLADIGVPAQFICMMASKAPGIMARTPEQLRAVADYVRGRGFEGSPPPSAVDAIWEVWHAGVVRRCRLCIESKSLGVPSRRGAGHGVGRRAEAAAVHAFGGREGAGEWSRKGRGVV